MFETLPSGRTRATLLDGGLSKTGVRRYESDDKYRDAEDQFRGDADLMTLEPMTTQTQSAPSLTMMATALSFLESTLLW